jgi:hypothetical protein
MHDGGTSQLRQLELNLLQPLLVGMVCLPTQLRDDRMLKWAIGVWLGHDGSTKSAQLLHGNAGHEVIVTLGGIDFCQGVNRLHEGGAEDRESGIVVVTGRNASPLMSVGTLAS